jgi:hypothetical protein
MWEVLIPARRPSLFNLLDQVNGLSMLGGHAVPDTDHFIESRFVNEVSFVYPNVLQSVEGAAAAPKSQGAAAIVNHG